mmetsp:Transcript_40751/g.93797  ORF Transcript_40751/g.93797 Transcript_40751/m.93797 type:complete len:308 (-) Transcript_40751:72-995(-)
MLVWRCPKAECALTCCLILHDTGWVSRWPLLALSALTAGIVLQSTVAWVKHSACDAHSVNQWCILFWLLGNWLWTWAELMWDGEKPVGLLGHLEFLEVMTEEWYFPVMVMASCLMVPTCTFILTFYLVRFAVTPCRHLLTPEEPDADAGMDYVLTPCLPLELYYEFFIVPWLVMDSSWGFMNLLDLRWEHRAQPVLICSVIAGLACLLLQCDCLRRYWTAGLRCWRDVAMVVAELAWVGGNIVWMVDDETSDEVDPEKVVPLFAVGIIFALCAALAPSQQLVSARQHPISAPFCPDSLQDAPGALLS